MENLGRVVLLMGGVSSEREVSLMSGEGVHKALVSKGVDVLKFDPKTDSLETLEKGGFDRAFIALHGRLGEDGTIQGVLNYLGIPYTGPGVTASAMAIDKDLTKRVWRSAGIPVPEGVMIDPKADDAVLEEAIACLGATGLVVKPAHDGSSIGVTKLAEPTVAALRKALEDAAGVRGDEVLVEEYIHGREFTVAVLDGRALPVIEIRAPCLLYTSPSPRDRTRCIRDRLVPHRRAAARRRLLRAARDQYVARHDASFARADGGPCGRHGLCRPVPQGSVARPLRLSAGADDRRSFAG